MNFKIPLLISITAFCFGCNYNTKENINAESNNNLEHYFVPLFSIDNTKNSQKMELERLALRGKFNYNDSLYYALSNYFNKKIYFFNATKGKITKSFTLPIQQDDVLPYVYEIFNFDSIVYLNYNTQELIICDTNTIKHKYKIKIDESFNFVVPTFPSYFLSNNAIIMPIQVLYKTLNTVSFYDSLMDIRPLYGIFKWNTPDSILTYNPIPINSSIKLNVKTPYRQLYNVHNFAFNAKKNTIITFPDVSDNFMEYNLKTEAISNLAISNSKYKITPVKVKRDAKVYEMQLAAENQNFHKLYYDIKSNKYLRYITVKKIDAEGITYKEIVIEIINDSFKVEKTLNINEDMRLTQLLNKVILVDNSTPLKAIYYEFNYNN